MIENELDLIIKSSLEQFANAVSEDWYGKEREAVSYYAFGFLATKSEPGSVIFDPAQIGIEVRVPAVGKDKKEQILKDLVIWPHPGATVFDENWAVKYVPLAVMEWKCRKCDTSSRYDANRYDLQ